MRVLMSLPVFLITATLAFAATDSVLYATVGSWSVFSDKTTANSCFAGSTFADGTTIRIGFWHKGYKFPAYVTFSNAKWRSIQVRKEYKVSMQLDSSPSWDGLASGWAIGNERAILINVDNPNLFKEFVRSANVRLTFRGKQVANLSLAGSGKAISELMNCQAVNVDNAPKQPPPQDDPFAIQEVKPESEDPFEL